MRKKTLSGLVTLTIRPPTSSSTKGATTGLSMADAAAPDMAGAAHGRLPLVRGRRQVVMPPKAADLPAPSGEGGIRTLERGLCPSNALAGRRLQPLGHFSVRAQSTHSTGPLPCA